MPVIEVSIQDLERLARSSLSNKELLSALELMKIEIEEIDTSRLVYEVSHDRADLFSAEGLGRAIAHLVGSREPKKFNVMDSGTYVDVSSAPAYRPYCLVGIVRDLSLDYEAIRQLTQLQEKLHLSYGRNRELVSIGFYDLRKVRPPIKYLAVDEAEYVPLGYGRPMKLSEVLESTEKGRLFSRLVRKGNYPLLEDSRGEILSFPPVLNGESTKVTEDTKDVLIDVTGTEPYLMMKLLNVMVTSFAERSSNPLIQTLSIISDGVGNQPFAKAPQLDGKIISVTSEEIKALGGVSLHPSSMSKILQSLGYVVEEMDKDSVRVWVPPYRIDVHDRVDVVEDVLIGYGYNRLKADITNPTHAGWRHPIEIFSDVVRNIMLGLGFTEVVNFMMVDADLIRFLTDEEFIEVANPKMKTYSAVRNSLIPSLLLTAKANYERGTSIEAFEVGDIIRVSKNEPISERHLGAVLMGENYTLTDGLVTVKTLINLLGEKAVWESAVRKPFIEGRTALVKVRGVQIGMVGEVHPRFLSELGVLKPTIIAEVSLEELKNAVISS